MMRVISGGKYEHDAYIVEIPAREMAWLLGWGVQGHDWCHRRPKPGDEIDIEGILEAVRNLRAVTEQRDAAMKNIKDALEKMAKAFFPVDAVVVSSAKAVTAEGKVR